MRLTRREQEIIRDAAREAFGADARVKLFGSRLDNAARGGDLDLLVVCSAAIPDSGLRAARLSALIQLQTGERKIDVLTTWPGAHMSTVHEIALQEGEEIL